MVCGFCGAVSFHSQWFLASNKYKQIITSHRNAIDVVIGHSYSIVDPHFCSSASSAFVRSFFSHVVHCCVAKRRPFIYMFLRRAFNVSFTSRFFFWFVSSVLISIQFNRSAIFHSFVIFMGNKY